MTSVVAITAEEFAERQDAQRRAGALEAFTAALASAELLEIPSPVTAIRPRKRGVAPKLSAEAFELARQVYFLQHGSRRDAARAIIAVGLSDTDNVTQVHERLKTWWDREEWPKRPTLTTFAIRDANHDGGLYRSDRICTDVTTGSGPAPKGKKCAQSALPDSDYCFHHDPRPEYVEARRVQTERLTAGRRSGMVPLEPFQRWCDEQRRRLLEDARARGEAHFNEKLGWKRLADAMGMDQSVLGRLMAGKHSSPDRPPVTMIRAATVARYVEPLGLTFKDVYGHEPPSPPRGDHSVCPGCGGPMNHGSKRCRVCYEATLGEPCSYVNRAGRRCGVPTRRMLFALDEYRRTPVHQWVAKRMWATNAGGVRGVFSSCKTLTGSLVKQFRKRGWHTVEDAERAFAELVAELGEPKWPVPIEDLEAGGMVPIGPFKNWLAARYAELGSYKELGERTGIHPYNISPLLRGTGRGAGKTTIRRATVERALERWGDGTTYAYLYEVPA